VRLIRTGVATRVVAVIDQNRDVLRTHVGTTFKKSPLADENTLGTGIPSVELGRSKIMWPTDIFPIRFELMYRQYYGDASKTA